MPGLRWSETLLAQISHLQATRKLKRLKTSFSVAACKVSLLVQPQGSCSDEGPRKGNGGRALCLDCSSCCGDYTTTAGLCCKCGRKMPGLWAGRVFLHSTQAGRSHPKQIYHAEGGNKAQRLSLDSPTQPAVASFSKGVLLVLIEAHKKQNRCMPCLLPHIKFKVKMKWSAKHVRCSGADSSGPNSALIQCIAQAGALASLLLTLSWSWLI